MLLLLHNSCQRVLVLELHKIDQYSHLLRVEGGQDQPHNSLGFNDNQAKHQLFWSQLSSLSIKDYIVIICITKYYILCMLLDSDVNLPFWMLN